MYLLEKLHFPNKHSFSDLKIALNKNREILNVNIKIRVQFNDL